MVPSPRRCALALVLAGSAICSTIGGCGSPAGSTFSAPSPLALGLDFDCGRPDYAFAGLEVTAYFAGNFPPCQLVVDPVRLTSSGTCDAIATGQVWHILIVYTRAADAVAPEPATTLALAVGSVDLRPESLPADPNEAVVAAIDRNDIMVYQEELDDIAIDGGSCETRDRTVALQWAKCFIQDTLQTSLNCGSGPDSNLVRACTGSLGC